MVRNAKWGSAAHRRKMSEIAKARPRSGGRFANPRHGTRRLSAATRRKLSSAAKARARVDGRFANPSHKRRRNLGAANPRHRRKGYGLARRNWGTGRGAANWGAGQRVTNPPQKRRKARKLRALTPVETVRRKGQAVSLYRRAAAIRPRTAGGRFLNPRKRRRRNPDGLIGRLQRFTSAEALTGGLWTLGGFGGAFSLPPLLFGMLPGGLDRGIPGILGTALAGAGLTWAVDSFLGPKQGDAVFRGAVAGTIAKIVLELAPGPIARLLVPTVAAGPMAGLGAAYDPITERMLAGEARSRGFAGFMTPQRGMAGFYTPGQAALPGAGMSGMGAYDYPVPMNESFAGTT